MRISTSLLVMTGLAVLPSATLARDAVDPPRVAYDYNFGGRGTELSGDQARWAGSWEGRYVDAASGHYEGVFRGTYLPAAPVVASAAPVAATAAAPVIMAAAVPVPVVTPGATAQTVVTQPQLSTVYPAYSYPYGYAPVIIRVEPAVRKTTTVVEEIIEP